MRRLPLLPIAVALVFAGFFLLRPAGSPPVEPLFPAQDDTGLARVAVYEGRLPCDLPGCDKVKVAIAVYGANGQQPTRYLLARVRVDGSDTRDLFSGSLSLTSGIQGYPEGQVWTLDAAAPADYARLWPVTPDILLILDENLTPRPGNASWGRMLSRIE